MTDLTKITTPFGLLDKETQDALRMHGGPYQTWYGDEVGWHEGKPAWDGAYAYRVKPQPPKPREWWAVVNMDGAAIALSDDRPNAICRGDKIIRVREVLSDD